MSNKSFRYISHKLKYFSVLLFCSLLYTLQCNAGYLNADSLISSLHSSTHDTVKIKTYLEAGYIYESSDLEKAYQLYNVALELSAKNLSEFLTEDGKIQNFNKAIRAHKYNRTFLLLLETSYRYRGIVRFLQGNLHESLNNYQISLKISEQLGEMTDVAKCFTNIGMVLSEQGKFDQALLYFNKGLKLNKSLNDVYGVLSCLTSIAGIYQKQESYFQALEIYNEAMEINDSLQDKQETSICLADMGIVYRKLKNYSKALQCFTKALLLDQEINDMRGTAIDLNNIANIYSLLGDYKRAEDYSFKSLEIAKSIGLKETMRISYGNLAECFSKQNNFAKAYQYLKLYSSIKDTIYNEQSNRLLSEMEAKYQSEKKQQEIELLNKDKQIQKTEIARQEAEVKQQTTQKYAFIGGFVLMLLLSMFVYLGYKNKKKANILLALQNLEIKQQKEEIETQRDEIEAQKEILENKNSEITDSINYARRIQTAVLPNIELIRKNQDNYKGFLNFDYFVLFKPKDIVSGDFYWATHINEYFIVTVADCTGHGVPGAFMSMLGVSFLNEIVRKKEVTRASEVLDLLRISVVDALQQKGNSGEQKDGMDIAFCVINTRTLELQFAGANNPCWIIVSHPSSVISPIIELKPDKQPIGIHTNMQAFTNQIYQLEKGDIIYLLSDGYEDQFGGPNRKKFLAKNLKNVLISNSLKSLKEQKQILETTLVEWIGDGEQIDDITILGLKI